MHWNHPCFSNVVFEVEDGGVSILPRPVTVQITGSRNSAVYDDLPHVVTGYRVKILDDLYTEDKIRLNGLAVASRTIAGRSMMGLTRPKVLENTDSNYEVTFEIEDGYQEILKAEALVRILGHQEKRIYDGESHTVKGYDVKVVKGPFKEEYLRFSGKGEAERTDAGRTMMGLDASQFTHTDGRNVDVTFEVEDGYLQIDPAAVHVVIQGESASFEYDGEEHIAEGYTFTADHPLYGKEDFRFTGSARAVRTEVGTGSMGMTGEDFTNLNPCFNAAFEVKDGGVTVTPIPVRVLIVGTRESVRYDGKEHLAQGYVTVIDEKRYTQEKMHFEGAASVAAVKAGSYPMGLTAGRFTNLDEHFAVRFEVVDGGLDIARRQVQITSGSGTKEYDGIPLTEDSVTVEGDGFAPGDVRKILVSGSRLLPGSSENTFAIEWEEEERRENYDLKETFGVLTVRNREVKPPIHLSGKQAEYLYDGSLHTVSGFEETEWTAGGITYRVTGIETTVNGKDAGSYTGELTGTAQVLDEAGNDVTAQFAVTVSPAALTIRKRKVMLTSASASRMENGSPLTDAGVSVTGDGFAKGEGVNYAVTGIQTRAGKSENTFTYTFREGTRPENYEVKTVFGTLIVTPKPAEEEKEEKPAASTTTKPQENRTTAGTTAGTEKKPEESMRMEATVILQTEKEGKTARFHATSTTGDSFE